MRDLLRGAPDGGVDTVAQYLAYLWQQRTDQYSALRQAGMVPAGNAERRVEMSFIGG